MQFEKFHGCGNDFIFLSADYLKYFVQPESLSQFAVQVCKPHFSIGADGVVFFKITSSMRVEILILNSDGSIAATCGNALRCLGLKLCFQKIWDGEQPLDVHRLNSPSSSPFARLISAKDGNEIEVAMGIEKEVRQMDGEHAPVFVQLANPHLVFILPQFKSFSQSEFIRFGIWAQNEYPLQVQEAKIPVCNIGMLTSPTVNERYFHLTVFERGAGFTQCCGSGATAARIALEKLQIVDKKDGPVSFLMPGGEVRIYWNQDERTLIGPALHVFSGELNINIL